MFHVENEIEKTIFRCQLGWYTIGTSHGIMLNREKLDLKALILTAKT
jgi:hypothetical protein